MNAMNQKKRLAHGQALLLYCDHIEIKAIRQHVQIAHEGQPSLPYS